MHTNRMKKQFTSEQIDILMTNAVIDFLRRKKIDFDIVHRSGKKGLFTDTRRILVDFYGGDNMEPIVSSLTKIINDEIRSMEPVDYTFTYRKEERDRYAELFEKVFNRPLPQVHFRKKRSHTIVTTLGAVEKFQKLSAEKLMKV